MHDYWQSKFVQLALLNWDERHRGDSAHKIRSEQFHVNKLSVPNLESATMEKLDSADQLVLAESVGRASEIHILPAVPLPLDRMIFTRIHCNSKFSHLGCNFIIF